LPFLLLLALLTPPALAMWRLWSLQQNLIAAICYVVASIVAYVATADDKQRARADAQRTPEKVLHVLELAGGWPGGFLAQQRHRHKTRKASYQAIFWLVVAAHELAAIDYLLEWQLTRSVMGTLT
jgi:uncharacterized membrane protein YsdA (DUF1294 family)